MTAIHDLRHRITDFFLFLAKTDRHALQFCTEQTNRTQASIGFIVLLTGSFAFMSGFFAVSSVFPAPENPGLMRAASVAVALLYACTIIAFDREIVSAERSLEPKLGDHLVTLGRIVFAVLIGFVISFPLELKLLEGRIVAQVEQDVERHNAGRVSEIAQLKGAQRQADSAWRAALAAQEAQVRTLSAEAASEARIIRPGPRYEAVKEQLTQAQQRLERLRAEQPLMTSADDARLAQLEGELAQAKARSTDFLSKAEALERLTKASAMAFWLSWILRLFFIALELMPTLIKLSLKYNEYHAYLAARRNMNVQKIHAYARLVMGEIEEDPRGALARSEFTNEIERAMEDPLRNTRPNPLPTEPAPALT